MPEKSPPQLTPEQIDGVWRRVFADQDPSCTDAAAALLRSGTDSGRHAPLRTDRPARQEPTIHARGQTEPAMLSALFGTSAELAGRLSALARSEKNRELRMILRDAAAALSRYTDQLMPYLPACGGERAAAAEKPRPNAENQRSALIAAFRDLLRLSRAAKSGAQALKPPALQALLLAHALSCQQHAEGILHKLRGRIF